MQAFRNGIVLCALGLLLAACTKAPTPPQAETETAAAPAQAAPAAADPAPTTGQHEIAVPDMPIVPALKSFVLTFPDAEDAQLQLELGYRSDPPRPIGLDGVPRVSSDGNFGIPVAVSGRWESDSTFLVEYNEIGNINMYRFRLRFSGDDVDVQLSERSRVIPSARFRGTSVS
ncbi:hypothetical protein MNO14_01820 [Luteimonas sp. S4-F44]|uniref:hypothetical protein n=1 Tax=Luteimonas sp. S4-F44 TaxID=2925842 RepID=UPI001F53B81E|nr:hypothetical protein [Luteimonas sp. S4-F44]UNK42871.1 hypothetical protein MNO14_01820 [Luteimonas sp. S4-F44]